jgi:hypothetical protein
MHWQMNAQAFRPNSPAICSKVLFGAAFVGSTAARMEAKLMFLEIRKSGEENWREAGEPTPRRDFSAYVTGARPKNKAKNTMPSAKAVLRID